MSVTELSQAKRTQALDAAQADLNGDGMIQGEAEAATLFRQLSGGADSLALDDPKSASAQAIKALENFASVSKNPPPGRVGHDPFEPDHRVASGNYQGEPINYDKRRSVVKLSPIEAEQYGVQPGELAFANYGHDGKHWVAIVPDDAVEKASIMMEYFPAPIPAGHSMLRFHLKEGKQARLVPQTLGATDEPVKLNDLVLSVEAAGPRNFEYDLLEGAGSHYGIVYSFESLSDRALHTQRNGNSVKQMPLKLSNDQLQKILYEAVHTADRARPDEMYNTLTKNCVNETFHIIDRGIGQNVSPQVHMARLLTAENLPPVTEYYMSIRGIRDDSHTMDDLAVELGMD